MDATIFSLHFTNVTCSSEGRTFDSADEAIEAGRQAGFEFSVWADGHMVVSWTVFGGLRWARVTAPDAHLDDLEA